MKKFISIMLVLVLFFSSTLNVFAIDLDKSVKGKNDLAVDQKSDGLTVDELDYLFRNGSITQKGLEFLAEIRGTSYSILLDNVKEKKISIEDVFNLLLGDGLTASELQNMIKADGIKDSTYGIKWLERNGLIDTVIPDSDFTIKPDLNIGSNLSERELREIGLGNFVSDLGNGNYKINFKDINKNNAGKVVRTWQGKNNFPKSLVLERGIKLKVQDFDLNRQFEKTTQLRQKVQSLKSKGVDIGTVEAKEPVLELLPDRIRITKATEFTYTTKNQLNNIKQELNLNPEAKENFQAFKAQKNVAVKSKLEDGIEKLKIEDDKMSKHFKNQLDLPSDDELDEGVIVKLMAECELDQSRNVENAENIDCSREGIEEFLEKSEKTFITEEISETSMILPLVVDGEIILSNTSAEDVEITSEEIIQIFDTYANIMTIALPEVDPGPIESGISDTNIFDTENFCQGDAECEELLAEKNERRSIKKMQKLLNGFTIGSHSSKVFKDRLRPCFLGYCKTLYKIEVEFYRAYGFGLRIPIIAEVETIPYLLDDFENANSIYRLRSKVYTVDGDEQHYIDTGLPEDKIFEGKEFVAMIDAGIKYDIRVIGDFIDVDGDIKLLSVLARLFKNELKDLFDLSDEQINKVISDGKIDKGQNFQPPFDEDTKHKLLGGQVEVPVRDFGIAKILARLGVDVFLKGYIDADCVEVNSNGGCISDTIRYKSTNWKNHGNNNHAQFNPNESKSDKLGVYSNFGIKLTNFSYIPVLLFEVFLAGGVKVKIPARGWEEFWTDNYTIYTYEFPMESLALGTHEGTLGTVDATFSEIDGEIVENKIYATNPEIDIDNPRFILRNNSNRTYDHNSRISFTSNLSNELYNMYTVDAGNPNCSNIGTRINAGGTEDDIIRKRPWLNPVRLRPFDIKTRGCSVYGNGTRVFTGNIWTLENTYFDIDVDSDWSSPRNINLEMNGSLENLNIRYDVDNPLDHNNNGCNQGLEGSSTLDLTYVATTKLQNDFTVRLSALACNNQNQTIPDSGIKSKQLTIHNTVFNPSINTSPIGYGPNKAKINRGHIYNGGDSVGEGYNNQQGYTTRHIHTLNGDIPVCDDTMFEREGYQESVLNEGFSNEGLGFARIDRDHDLMLSDESKYSMVFSTILGQTIKVVACIYNPQGYHVFTSDVISKTVNNPVDNDMVADRNLEERLRGELTHEEILDFVDGFRDGGFTDPLGEEFGVMFLDGLEHNLFTAKGLAGLGTIFKNGGLEMEGMKELGGIMNMGSNQRLSGLRTMMRNGKATLGGLQQISGLIGAGNMTPEGLNLIASFIDTGSMTKGLKGNGGAVPKNTPQTMSFDFGGAGGMGGFPTGVDLDCATQCVNANDVSTCYDNCLIEKEQNSQNNDEEYNEDENTLPIVEYDLYSEDEYVNDKLNEINECFVTKYNKQLETIEQTISKFEDIKENTSDDIEKRKYERALKKLNEISELFIRRYEIILTYVNSDDKLVLGKPKIK